MVQGKNQPYIIELAGRITSEAGVRPAFFSSMKEYEVARMRAIYDWVRANTSYIHDGFDVENGTQKEVVRDVENILRPRAGDCDDLTILTGALILASFEGYVDQNGIRRAPVEVWLYGKNDTPGHVFPVGVLYTGQKIIMDTAANPSKGFGDLPGNGGAGEMFWKTDLF